MTAPQLRACYFDPPGCQYARLARVLLYTARQHCAAWDVAVERIEPEKMAGARSASDWANTQKLEWWARQVQAAPEGARILLIDADTMILRALDDVWALEFDLAYTEREKGGSPSYPFNAGVIFLRATPTARAFFELWREENRRMFADKAYHAKWHQRFGGMNQAALGKLLNDRAAERLGARLERLPCSEWNCEDSSWHRYAPGRTRIVHVKSALHRAALGTAGSTFRVRPLALVWRALERQAGSA